MPQVSFKRPEDTPVLHVELVDSMGRNREVRRQMEKNDPKPPAISDKDESYAAAIRAYQTVYPKTMYRLALRKGMPNGDEIFPGTPIPIDQANALGLTGQTITMGASKAVIAKRPYRTIMCGVVRPDGITVDIEASEAQERKLFAEGWVDSLSKVVGLPKSESEDWGDDPLPNHSQSGTGNKPKTGVATA